MKSKTLQGFFWSFIGVGGLNILQFVILFVLARILDKSDFGVMGILNLFILFIQIFSLVGVGPAIVQMKNLNDRHLSTAMTMSVVLGCVFMVLLFAASGSISEFFNMPKLSELLKAIVVVFPIMGLANVSNSLLQRNLQFKTIAKIEISTYFLAYGIIGLSLAFANYGIWSLVIAQISQSIISTIWQLSIYKRKISLKFYKSEFCELIYFGGGFTVARIANYFANQADNFVVGKMLNSTALGIYSMVFKLISTPANLIGTVIDRVLFAVMANDQEDKVKLESMYYRSVLLIFIIFIPFTSFITIYSKEIIQITLGTKWSDAAVPFQMLAFSLVFRTSYKISDSLTRATGKVYKRALIQILYASMVLGGAIYGSRYGIIGVSISTSIVIFINYCLMLVLSLKILNGSYLKYLIMNLKYFALFAVNFLLLKTIYENIQFTNMYLNVSLGIAFVLGFNGLVMIFILKRDLNNYKLIFKRK